MQEAEYQTIFIVYSIGTTNVQIKKKEVGDICQCHPANLTNVKFFKMKVNFLIKQDFYQHTRIKQTKHLFGYIMDKCIQIGNTALTQYSPIHWVTYI